MILEILNMANYIIVVILGVVLGMGVLFALYIVVLWIVGFIGVYVFGYKRKNELKMTPLPLLFDKYYRTDGILKTFEKWEQEDLKSLLKYLKGELKTRTETRPFW